MKDNSFLISELNRSKQKHSINREYMRVLIGIITAKSKIQKNNLLFYENFILSC